MAQVHGTCSERFAQVRAEFEENLRSGEELGASIAIDLDGETVVDFWGGCRDAERTTPWTEDTITNVWSTTKTVTSLAALMLADRGELDVARARRPYWPEFAANGKEAIEVRHLMSHTSGVSGWDAAVRHRGHLRLGEVDRPARRAGAVVGAGHGVGLPRAQPGPPRRRGRPAHHRALAQGRSSPRRSPARSAPTSRSAPRRPTGTGSLRSSRPRRCRSTWRRSIRTARCSRRSPARRPTPTAANTPAWRRADIGAPTATATPARSPASSGRSRWAARSTACACSRRTIDAIFEEQANGVDLVLGVPLRFGIGYGLPRARRARCRTCPTAASASGAAGAAR